AICRKANSPFAFATRSPSHRTGAGHHRRADTRSGPRHAPVGRDVGNYCQWHLRDIDVYANTDINPGSATDFWKARIDTKGASHLYILQNTVIPGGTFGWHSHTGPSLVIVVSGTATEYEGNDPTCTPHLHPSGSTFVDAGEASGHLVRNDSTTDNLVVIVVRLIPEALVPAQRIDKPNPGYCSNIN